MRFMNSFTAALLTCALWGPACTQQNGGEHSKNRQGSGDTEAGKGTMTAMNDIRAVAQAFVDSWNNRELQSITRLVTTDMEFVNSLGLWWRGEAEVVRGLQQMNAFGAHVTPDPIDIRILTADAAVANGSFSVSSFIGPDGQKRPEQKGVMTLFIVNQGQGWRIAAGQITAVNETVIAQIQARSAGTKK